MTDPHVTAIHHHKPAAAIRSRILTHSKQPHGSGPEGPSRLSPSLTVAKPETKGTQAPLSTGVLTQTARGSRPVQDDRLGESTNIHTSRHEDSSAESFVLCLKCIN